MIADDYVPFDSTAEKAIVEAKASGNVMMYRDEIEVMLE